MSDVALGVFRVHIVLMTRDSKIFVGLRSARKRSPSPSQATGPKCQWDGCEKSGTHRAPVGSGAEGLYLLFCLEHVTDYNKGYSFTTPPSNADVARYQKEATTGARPTWGKRVSAATETPLPSSVRSGSAKTLNARKADRQGQTRIGAQQEKASRYWKPKLSKHSAFLPRRHPKKSRAAIRRGSKCTIPTPMTETAILRMHFEAQSKRIESLN